MGQLVLRLRDFGLRHPDPLSSAGFAGGRGCQGSHLPMAVCCPPLIPSLCAEPETLGEQKTAPTLSL